MQPDSLYFVLQIYIIHVCASYMYNIYMCVLLCAWRSAWLSECVRTCKSGRFDRIHVINNIYSYIHIYCIPVCIYVYLCACLLCACVISLCVSVCVVCGREGRMHIHIAYV